MSSKKLNDNSFQIKSKHNRTFSEEFRRSKVQEIIEKRLTIKELCRLHGVSRQTVYNWIYKYSSAHERGVKTVVQMESEAQRTQYLLDRTAELERVIGQKQLEVDFLNKVIELGSDEVGFDLKKKYAPQLWNGSDNTNPSLTST